MCQDLPDRGSGGRQRGLGGHVNFADRDLEKIEFTSDFNVYGSLNWRVFRLFSSFIFIKCAVMWLSVLFRYFPLS